MRDATNCSYVLTTAHPEKPVRGRRKTRQNHYNLSPESMALVDRAKETMRGFEHRLRRVLEQPRVH
jgi:hypothetical protein